MIRALGNSTRMLPPMWKPSTTIVPPARIAVFAKVGGERAEGRHVAAGAAVIGAEQKTTAIRAPSVAGDEHHKHQRIRCRRRASTGRPRSISMKSAIGRMKSGGCISRSWNSRAPRAKTSTRCSASEIAIVQARSARFGVGSSRPVGRSGRRNPRHSGRCEDEQRERQQRLADRRARQRRAGSVPSTTRVQIRRAVADEHAVASCPRDCAPITSAAVTVGSTIAAARTAAGAIFQVRTRCR